MNNGIIKVDKISKIYNGNTYALDGLNLSITKGDWTSITGPSGSGKNRRHV